MNLGEPTAAAMHLPTPTPRSTLLLNLTVHHHDRLLHERTKGFLVVVDGKDFCLGDDQRTAGADDLTSGDQLVSYGRRNEVQFVLDGQDRGAGWHHRHCRVAGGRIGNGPDDATMHKSMLLLNAFPVAFPVGKMDFGAAVLNDGQRSPDQVHHILPVETLTNTLCEMWVRNVSHALYLSIALRSLLHRGIFQDCRAVLPVEKFTDKGTTDIVLIDRPKRSWNETPQQSKKHWGVCITRNDARAK